VFIRGSYDQKFIRVNFMISLTAVANNGPSAIQN
jgi:hypothetical protein